MQTFKEQFCDVNVPNKDVKTTRWAFTAYEGQWELFKTPPPIVAEWGWQTEICPETQRPHYQGYIRTSRQVRFSQIHEHLHGVHLNAARNWIKLLQYCKKKDTAVPGTQVHQVFQPEFQTMAEVLIKVAKNRPRDLDFSKCESVKEFKEMFALEFEQSVATILKVEENLVGLLSQPQYERAYTKWRSVWTEKSDEIDRQTDRQTAEEEA